MDVNEIEKVIRGILAERVPGLKVEDIVMQGSDILHLKTLAAAVEYVAKRLQEA